MRLAKVKCPNCKKIFMTPFFEEESYCQHCDILTKNWEIIEIKGED